MGSQRVPGLVCAAVGAAALTAVAARNAAAMKATAQRPNSTAVPVPRFQHAPRELAHITAARSLNRGSALLALSVLADSAMEHYRGSFDNSAMYTPLVSSALSLLAGLHGGGDPRSHRHTLRHAVYLTAAIAGVSGTAFHVYNVTKRPGGWSWNNLFHAAPIGAPMALLLSGALGAAAERLRDEPAVDPQLFGMPAGRALGLLVTAGLAGTIAEVGLLHFRGSFQNPVMYAPVMLPPVAAALLAQASLGAPCERWFTRLWLRITAALGFVGVGFHARGIARNQGGWRNWSQNLFNGPPLPAPPGFSALALAGLAALRLRETEK
ncbi:hypothetical protein [Paraburkholderia gardini]|uniref:Uncharacterized protein n=1 Tax=Paraburkholderia gardini TaxID=2823469 RepID=A0ABM8U976_9BURK|nr:hypothetical protein [Paraburkholderia gardini]CAG4918312.1 hypothetical protein R54767_04493 [Paraburkholderia gardini]